MIYYPKANITPNLYSNGNVFLKGTNQPYTGYYFTTFDGKAYTGREPGDGVNIELTPPTSNLIENQDTTNPDYRFIGTNDFYSSTLLGIPKPARTPSLTPTKYYPVPQDSDYQAGEFQRYFSKKVNENIYTETRAIFQNELYIGFSIPWSIRGNIDEVAKVNQRIVALKEAELGILGLGLYLKNNYIQFYK
jgi:hypothetical protein